MRQKIRRIILYISLALFPVTMNYLSPYVSIDGAMAGVVSGSVIVFFLLFLSGLFFGRAWCGWVCPAGGLAEICTSVNAKPVPVKKLRIIRYSIFAVWFAILVAGFVLAGGIHGVDPLHLTERVISVDEPVKYIVYYMVMLIFFVLTITIGRRGACHTICWMSPFLTAGMWLGRKLRLPQMRIKANADACIDCKLCNKKCPMSINVSEQVKGGSVRSLDCILCGECVDACPKDVLSYRKRK
jgi:polyferredoxin